MNNLGQLGIDSNDSQVNRPEHVEALASMNVLEIAAGESSFAINANGELFVWGLYNL